MRSIAIALTWEFWRKNQLWIVSVIMFMACITISIVHDGVISRPDTTDLAKIHYKTLFYVFVCVAFFTLRSQFDRRNNRLGFPAHMYIKPTQTWVLVENMERPVLRL